MVMLLALKPLCRKYVLISCALTILLMPRFAWSDFSTPADFAILMDYDSGAFLYEKNADAPMKPASMAKMMTAFMVFERLAEGSLNLNDRFNVSEKAYRIGGSRMFLELNSQVTVDELLRGIIVQSGNDSAIVLAEGLAGDETSFAEEMTEKAKALGMTQTNFTNSTGWPDENMTTTARDMAILARETIKLFPEEYSIYKEKSYSYNNIEQGNRNPLLYGTEGADGLKTGHTEESGYGLVGSATRNGQRFILVLNGLSSKQERRQESARLMEASFATFKQYELLKAGEVLVEAPVYLGKKEQVNLVTPSTVKRVLTRKSYKSLSSRMEYPKPLEAPLTEGQDVGSIYLMLDGVETRYPLVTDQAVAVLPWYERIIAFAKYLVFGDGVPAPSTEKP